MLSKIKKLVTGGDDFWSKGPPPQPKGQKRGTPVTLQTMAVSVDTKLESIAQKGAMQMPAQAHQADPPQFVIGPTGPQRVAPPMTDGDVVRFCITKGRCPSDHERQGFCHY